MPSYGRILAVLLCANALVAGQDGFRLHRKSQDVPVLERPETHILSIRRARSPIIVDVKRGREAFEPGIPSDGIRSVVKVLDENPGRLVAIRFPDRALQFNELGRATREALLERRGTGVIESYNTYMAAEALELLHRVRSDRPGAPLTIVGLPFEGKWSGVDSANEAYARVTQELSAFVAAGSLLTTAIDGEGTALGRCYPNTMAAADGRAVIFNSNGEWRIATGAFVAGVVASEMSASGVDEPAAGLVDAADLEIDVLATPLAADQRPDLEPSEVGMFETPPDDSGKPGLASNSGSAAGVALGGSSGGGTGGVAGPGGGISAGIESGSAEHSAADQSDSSGPTDHEAQATSEEDPGEDSSPDSEDLNWNAESEVDGYEGNEVPDGGGGSGDDSYSVPDDPLGNGDTDSEDGTSGQSEEPSIVYASLGSGPVGTYPTLESIGGPADFGFDCEVMSGWNTVPHHSVTGEVVVGLVAFHQTGIANVKFSFNGGPWLEINEMRLNSQTQCVEYCCGIDVGSLPSGDPLEVRAIVTPRLAGVQMALDPLILRASDGADSILWCAPWGDDEIGTGTEASPFRQPGRAIQAHQIEEGGVSPVGACDGLRIHLMEGEYEATAGSLPYPSTEEGWLVICAAPGVRAEDVVIRSGSGVRTRWIKFEGITFSDFTVPSRVLPNGDKQRVWIDRCRLIGTGPHGGRSPINSAAFEKVYVTDCEFVDLSDGPKFADLVRSSVVRRVGSDAFTGSRVVVNCEAHEMLPAPGAHSDVYQVFCPTDSDDWQGAIVFDLIATGVPDQGIFLSDCHAIQDVVLANVLVVRVPSASPATAPYSQIRCVELHNILIDNVTFANQALFIDADWIGAMTIKNSLFAKVITSQEHSSQINGDRNHFVDSASYGASTFGAEFTTGPVSCRETMITDLGLMGSPDDSVQGIRPLESSIVNGRVDDAASPFDAAGDVRSTVSAVGALEP